MSGNMRHLQDVSFVEGHVRVKLRFGQYAQRFFAAQRWLGNQVLTDNRPNMPLRTGSLQQRSYVTPDGTEVVFPGPYARFLYMGKVMVDPETGSPWARRDAVKVTTDRDLDFQVGVARWAEVTARQKRAQWAQGCARILSGR